MQALVRGWDELPLPKRCQLRSIGGVVILGVVPSLRNNGHFNHRPDISLHGSGESGRVSKCVYQVEFVVHARIQRGWIFLAILGGEGTLRRREGVQHGDSHGSIGAEHDTNVPGQRFPRGSSFDSEACSEGWDRERICLVRLI